MRSRSIFRDFSRLHALFVLTLPLIAAACTFPGTPAPNGAVQLALPTSRALPSLARWEIEASSASGLGSFKTSVATDTSTLAESGHTITLDNLLPGRWTFTVTGFNSSNLPLYTKTAELEVVPGPNALSITLTPVTYSLLGDWRLVSIDGVADTKQRLKVEPDTENAMTYLTLANQTQDMTWVPDEPLTLPVALNALTTITEGAVADAQGTTYFEYTFLSTDRVEITYGPGMAAQQTGTCIYQREARYTLAFHANGGTGTPPQALQLLPGESTWIPSPYELAMENHTPTGWTETTDGSGILYRVEDEFTMPAHNVTLYAKWDFTYAPVEIKVDNAAVKSAMYPAAGLYHQGYYFSILDIPSNPRILVVDVKDPLQPRQVTALKLPNPGTVPKTLAAANGKLYVPNGQNLCIYTIADLATKGDATVPTTIEITNVPNELYASACANADGSQIYLGGYENGNNGPAPLRSFAVASSTVTQAPGVELFAGYDFMTLNEGYVYGIYNNGSVASINYYDTANQVTGTLETPAGIIYNVSFGGANELFIGGQSALELKTLSGQSTLGTIPAPAYSPPMDYGDGFLRFFTTDGTTYLLDKANLAVEGTMIYRQELTVVQHSLSLGHQASATLPQGNFLFAMRWANEGDAVFYSILVPQAPAP